MSTHKSNYILLLSGGLDSVVNLHAASRNGKILMAITFDYGQRSVNQEIRAAKYFCEKLNVKHEIVEIPWLTKLTHTALVEKSHQLPKLQDLDNLQEATASAKAVWVPNRNG